MSKGSIGLLLPLVTYPDAPGAAVVDRTVDLARLLDAAVTGLAVEVEIAPITNPLAERLLHVADLIKETEDRCRRSAEHLLARLAEAATAAGVTAVEHAVRAAPDRLGDAVAGIARTHDLVTLPLGGGPAERDVAETVLFESGRPIVLLPAASRDALRFETVAVAWDGSRAAARSLFDAMPLLHRARRILVMSVTDDKPIAADRRDALRAHFGRHGLSADHVSVPGKGQPIGAVLQEEALSAGGGAPGDGRLRPFAAARIRPRRCDARDPAGCPAAGPDVALSGDRWPGVLLGRTPAGSLDRNRPAGWAAGVRISSV